MIYDIAIIGNGIIGLSTALSLSESQEKLNIIVIGPKLRTGAATPAAAAMLNSFAEIDYSSFKSKFSKEYFDLSRKATAVWPEFEKKILEYSSSFFDDSINLPQLKKSKSYGTYVINNTSVDELDDWNYDAIRSALVEYNHPFNDVDPVTIQGYKPSPKNRAMRSLFIEGEGWLNPKLVLRNIETALEKKFNVQFADVSAIKFVLNDKKVTSVKCSDEREISAGKFLLANGFDFSTLLQRSGMSLPQWVYSGVGASVEVRTKHSDQKVCIRTPNRGGACGIYVVPFQNPSAEKDFAHFVIGASNFVSKDPKFFPRSISIAHLLESGTKEINENFFDAEMVGFNIGNRPTTFDQYPLIGNMGDFKNLFVATGTKRDGFHLAPVVAEALREMMVGSQIMDNSFALFHPDREPIRDLSMEDSVKQITTGLISEYHQHGFMTATGKQLEQYIKSLEDEVRKVHEKFNKGDFGIPYLMYKLVRDGRI